MRSDAKVRSAIDDNPSGGFANSARDSFSGNERNHLFLGREGKQFEDISGLSGLDHPGDSRAFAVFDYDRDGWQDLAVVSANSPFFSLYQNRIGHQGGGRSVQGNMIALRFVGGNHVATPVNGRSNRDGIGTKVIISLPGMKLVREHRAGEGRAAQNSSTMFIGIGEREYAENVSVTWASQVVQTIGNVPAGTLVTVYEDPEQAPAEEGFVFEPYHVQPRESIVGRPRQSPTSGRQLLLQNMEGRNSEAKLKIYTAMATWCPKCANEMPQVRRLKAVFGPDELDLFAVPVDETETQQDFEAYVTNQKPAYKLLSDLSSKQVASMKEVLREELRSEGFPATIVTSGRGNVLAAVWGVPSISMLRKLLEDQSANRSKE